MRATVLVVCSLVFALGVVVAPAPAGNSTSDNVKLCKGWQIDLDGIHLTVFVRSDGSSFGNFADCVTYAAKGGAVVPKSQFDCESYGGTFVIGAMPMLWTCVGWVNNGADFQDKFDQLAADCVGDALAAGFESSSASAINYTVPGSGDVICEGLG
jgi:hypothetical protein